MTIKVIEYNGTKHLIECKSFEFRTNQVSNWIRLEFEDGTSKEIHRICVIKLIN